MEKSAPLYELDLPAYPEKTLGVPPRLASDLPRWRLALTWFCAIAVVLAICAAFYLRDARQIEQSIRDREVLRVALISRFFVNDFSGVASDLRVLGEDEALRAYLKGGEPGPLDVFRKEILHLGDHHREYDQIRYIDEKGLERARVNIPGGAVPDAELQMKADRPFFRDTMKLADGEVDISAFDLNVDHGAVVRPLKPTIRFATPVFDAAGNRRGIVAINYLGATLLDNLKQISPANQHRMRVLNARGYWLHAADPDDEWGFQLPGRSARTLAVTAPDLWREIAANTDGQVPYRGGWFTWQRVTPAAAIENSHSEDPFLIVASEFSNAERVKALVNRRQTFLVVAGIMMLVATIGVWLFYARERERRRAQHALRLAHAAAQESTRLKAQFLANMSHEIRTPMNGVIGMIGLLLDTPLSADQRSLANVVRTSADSLLTLINDILDFSKIEAGQLTFESAPFDLTDPVENCFRLLAEKAHQKGIELAYLIEENVPLQLVGDSGRLHQVMVNLVGNAVKFTEQGEVVMRVAKVSDENRRVRLRFSVRDTGVGIAPEAHARLFQPFVQADSGTTRQYGGSGLGLAICRQLISLMGGEISLESVPGRGSTFSFTAEFQLQEATARVIAHPADLAGMRALVVDDSETNREILTRQLAAWRVESRAVASAKEALAELRAGAAAGQRFHFGVFDMKMPGMSGLDLARAMRAEPALAGVRMIILSSIGQPPPRAELEAAGIGASLTKPVRQSQLHDALSELLAGPRPEFPPPVFPFAPAGEERGGAKLRILVAEDNVVNQHVALLQLQRLGYEPRIVANGRQALAAVQADTYDVVLMDCQMPGLDGFETTRRMRAWEAGRAGSDPPPLYIIALTASAMVGDRETCLAAGMSDYVSKPVRAADLAAALARAQVPAAS